MKSNHIKAVVFDMGGVLLQTKDKNPRSQLAQRFGLSYEALSQLVFKSETAQLATVGAIDEMAHWAFIAKHFQLNDAEIVEFWDDFWGGDQLDQELLKFTKTLKPDFAIGLLSNAWDGARDYLTRKFGILDIFDVSVFSAEVRMAKPDHAIYHCILDAMKVEAGETIFVDDFIENIQAAQELGFKTVHFTQTKQAIQEINTILGT
ncbi:MAG: HAD family phosphatase [Anaerolineaceae bacterium]|nr:HAD family phosphatase [Anaerolineaceae bacterium]